MSTLHSLRIQPVGPDQAAELSALCNQIYPQHFTYLWFDQGAWYQAHSYNQTKLHAELEDPNVRYYFTLLNERPVGYLKLKLDSPLNGEPGGFEIERIYLLREAAGQGLGKQVIDFAVDLARQLNRRYVWLHVMDSSTDSVAFYRGRGFRPVGETELPYGQMKPEYRRMWQMYKPL